MYMLLFTEKFKYQFVTILLSQFVTILFFFDLSKNLIHSKLPSICFLYDGNFGI